MRLIVSLLCFGCLLSCNSNDAPDVSKIKVQLSIARFERDLFKRDTVSFVNHLDQVIRKYPSFGENFITTILNADPAWSADSVASYVKTFTSAYLPVYDSSQKVFSDFQEYMSEIQQALRYVRYYFPQYNIPSKIITYIGPLDGYGDILADDALIVGLHHYLGKEFSLYKTALVSEVYPGYITERFEPEYIAVNCMKNIVNDMFPEKPENQSLSEQMVEKGKRLFLLSKFLPEKKEHMLIGYTEKQLKECYEHERSIWNLFVQNNLLQSKESNVISNYIGESPKTQELGEASPGNIGSFAGWQIVKKFCDENKIAPSELMKLSSEEIYQKARYKP